MAFPPTSLLVSFLVGFVVLYGLDLPVWISVSLVIALFLATGGWNFGLKFKTLKRDFRYISQMKKVVDKVHYRRSCHHGIGDLFSDAVKRHPTKTAVIFEEEKWTFQELEDISNRIGNYFKSTGLQPGSTVALFAPNCPQYIAVLLGLGKIGVKVALINTNLRHNALVHSIEIVNCSLILFGGSLYNALSDVRSDLGSSLLARSYCIDGESTFAGSVSLEGELERVSSDRPPPYEDKSFDDILCYIYTSGTTGLPKACRIKHSRFILAGLVFGEVNGVTSDDVIYNSLPLYHSSGVMCALGQMLFSGTTFVLRKNFSASHFWSDATKYNCTVVFYIGEICRYLLAQPQQATDTQHNVRLAIGNGLRAEIWEKFKNRFQIDTIGEFYACTEGNVAFFNQYNKVGSCGRTLLLIPGIPKAALVKFDRNTGEPLRNSRGFCIKTDVNEPGLLLGPITKKTRYDGYHDSKASEKKILRGAFKAGDAYFNSGDVLRMDEEGFMTGVETLFVGKVQGMDGRTGMAAIAGGEGSVDLDALISKLFLLLPHYAVPRFVRLIGSTEILTGTYKLKKTSLRNEGFDLTKVFDPIYMLDLAGKRYVPFTKELQQKLFQGFVPGWLRRIVRSESVSVDICIIGDSTLLSDWGLELWSEVQNSAKGFSVKNILDKVDYRRSCRHGIGDLFSDVVKRHPTKAAVIFEEEKWTFRELEDISNRIGNYFKSTGLQPGSTVALFAPNCPQYIAVLLGLGKIGVKVALINTNLRHNALVHSIEIVNCSLILFGGSLYNALSDVRSDLGSSLLARSYCIDGESTFAGSVSLEGELERVSSDRPPPCENKSFDDILCYIYTSGTTGLPKACRIRHSRCYQIGLAFHELSGVTSDDVIYNSLPLYHTSGGVCALGQMLFSGNTFVLRKKFSASHFWSDAAKYNCTVVFYIGEMCRYLLAQPQQATDTQHNVRLAIGNGLRAEIWEKFKNRFQIDTIGEFYGCTEGNVAFFNQFNKIGSCGRTLLLIPGIPKAALVKFDQNTGEPLRNSRGFCIKTDVNEPGLLLGPITKKTRYDGYHDSKASEKKILRGAFKAGDAYFNSGDVLRMDEEGFMYFHDRSGDTFRWKGENVSTTEVEATMSSVLELQDVVVYGVQVQGMDGRAGMAAIAGGEGSVDLDALTSKLFLLLPQYAVPRFVRLIGSTEILTGTYKLKKTSLRNEGFDLTKVFDPIYMLDLAGKRYVPFTQELQQKLFQGSVRL